MGLLLSCDDSIDSLFWKGLNIYNIFLLENDPDLARKYANDTLNYFKAFIENSQEQEDNRRIISCMADIYFRVEDFNTALDLYTTALHQAHDNNDKIWILSDIAQIYAKSRDYNGAIKYFNDALQLADKTTPTSKIYYDMGVMYFDQNRWQEAKKAFLEALKIRNEDVWLKFNLEYEIDILWHLGTIAYDMKDYENVIIYLNEVLKKIKNNYYYANTHLTIGHYYLIIGEYEKAREHYNYVLTAPNAYDEEIEIAKDGLKKLPLNG